MEYSRSANTPPPCLWSRSTTDQFKRDGCTRRIKQKNATRNRNECEFVHVIAMDEVSAQCRTTHLASSRTAQSISLRATVEKKTRKKKNRRRATAANANSCTRLQWMRCWCSVAQHTLPLVEQRNRSASLTQSQSILHQCHLLLSTKTQTSGCARASDGVLLVCDFE
jgi:hypothetical protein